MGKIRCKCSCGYTCNRKCGLPVSECVEQHFVHRCEHIWDGPPVQTDVMGCDITSVTCSKCGVLSVHHHLDVGL